MSKLKKILCYVGLAMMTLIGYTLYDIGCRCHDGGIALFGGGTIFMAIILVGCLSIEEDQEGQKK